MIGLYRLLLALLPAAFRREYGGVMLDALADRWRREQGAWRRAGVALHATGDLVRTALALQRETTVRDLAFGVRTLRRAPGFALTALLVTALGVGASAAAFSVAEFTLLRPLPFPAAERLVKLWYTPADGGRMEMSPPNFRDFQSASTLYERMGAYHAQSVTLHGAGDPQRVEGTAVTPEVLPLLGVQPMLGRLFGERDGRDGGTAAVILAHDYWQSAFGGDSAILGRTLVVDQEPKTVIGVMPPSFAFPNRRSALLTVMPHEEIANDERGNNWFTVIGRLRPGVAHATADAEARTIAARLAATHPAELAGTSARLTTLRDELSQQSRLLLLGLCAASLCVLLVACTNLANLLLARTMARRRELVVRTALGAGRERLSRQLVTESVLLGGTGALVGAGLAFAAVPLLVRLIPTSLPVAADPGVHVGALVAAAAIAMTTGLLFGTLPALRTAGSVGGAAGGGGFDALRDGARGGDRNRLRAMLVTAQVAACVVLIAGTGLLGRALLRVQALDPGFRADGAFMVRTALAMPEYATLDRRTRVYDAVLARTRALPGVTSAAYVTYAPMVAGGGVFPVAIPGKTERRNEGHRASLRFVTPDYFRTMGIALRSGRDVALTDDRDAPAVAVVSESFAARYWPGEPAIGRRFGFANQERTVIGVVGEVRMRGLERQSEPQVYLSYRQVPDSSLPAWIPKDLVVRATAGPDALVPSIRAIVRDVDPRQPISDVQMLSEVVDGQTASREVQVRVLGLFAAISALLAAIGIHGLLAFMVGTRRREIGVRMALGASPARVIGLVVRQGLALTLAGVVPGLCVAYVAGRAMEAVLAGVPPGDFTTLGLTTLLCVVMAAAGSLLPALRAVRVPPAIALRAD